MACSDSSCVVPVGDFEIFAFGPGAEAPGWPYVVPVGDFGRKVNYDVALNHFAAVAVFADRNWVMPVLPTRHRDLSASSYAGRNKRRGAVCERDPFVDRLARRGLTAVNRRRLQTISVR